MPQHRKLQDPLADAWATIRAHAHTGLPVEADASRLAFADPEFLLRRETRGIRFQLELLKPDLEQAAHGIENTVVVFGSARIRSQEEAQKQGLLAPANRNVVILHKDGRAIERLVQVGIANTQFFELKEGLTEGDKVLTGPIRKLKELKDKASVGLRARSDTDLAKTKESKK